MDIDIFNDKLVPEFMNGNLVFKVTSTKNGKTIDIGMVTTKEDYSHKVYTHQYIPFLFLLTFYQQAAYIYGCMNRKYQESRDSKFTFWWRRLRTKEWNEWFVVNPYKESLFAE